ncbi:unnamed protein product [Acanthoscelides obtectus]|uniref:Uncharacterized protein n=1 Tax=Acanthoscelides obtectus TaxID=200917 RepID=A0A9P0KNN5_ACAOB|nr:unnamed protein product [Acanthoscelides obtectus]CAK1638182.1 hypothetical protein AOBTE_LOCUS10435 [Acanthoscelides obtectus]
MMVVLFGISQKGLPFHTLRRCPSKKDQPTDKALKRIGQAISNTIFVCSLVTVWEYLQQFFCDYKEVLVSVSQSKARLTPSEAARSDA